MRKLILLFVVACVAILLIVSCGPRKESLKSAGQVLAKRTEQGQQMTNPFDKGWEQMPVYSAQLKLQDITEPKLATPGVASMDVRAVFDDQWLVLRLDWPDSTQDTIAVPSKFSDAAAVEFPTVIGSDVPDAKMGKDQKPVQIVQWKAVWQTKMDGGMSTHSLYPNAAIDHYPPEAAKDSASRQLLERQYAPAWNAGNLNAHPTSAAKAYVAEGFGSLTPVDGLEAKGQGEWKSGHWYVTITQRLPVSNASSPLRPGQRTYMALAAWDGSAGDVGSRKMRTPWIPFLMESQTKLATP
jgi:DMSO reductase family type II enzyme heme b subunit